MKDIIKQLIESQISNYLEESYEDNLVESIFKEVSEETWEAIEEAILNELSPSTLKSYIKKAKPEEKRAERTINKSRDAIAKAEQDRIKSYGLKNRNHNTHSDRQDKRRSTLINRADKLANNSASKLQHAKSDLETAERKSHNRGVGIWRASERISK